MTDTLPPKETPSSGLLQPRLVEPLMVYKQFTTVLNPRVPQWSEPRGWRLHTVKVPIGVTFDELRKLRSLCGLRPKHGWGGDLFIDEPCARCEAIMDKLNAEVRHGAKDADLD